VVMGRAGEDVRSERKGKGREEDGALLYECCFLEIHCAHMKGLLPTWTSRCCSGRSFAAAAYGALPLIPSMYPRTGVVCRGTRSGS